MSNKRRITEVIRFYMNSGYVNSNAEEDHTLKEILCIETQEELDKLSEEYIEEACQEYFEGFMANQDTGYYSLGEEEDEQ